MLKICMITPNLLPVPNVNGGAIEGLVTNVIKEQEKSKKMDLTVVSIYDKNALKESRKYNKTDFIYIKKNIRYAILSCVYKILNKIFHKNFNTYNHIVLRKIRNKKFDYIIVEGGHYESFKEYLKYFNRDQMILHLHHQGISNDTIDQTFSKLIGVSKFVTNYFSNTTSKIECKYLNNGINTNDFDKKISEQEIEILRKKYNILPDDFVILFCGRLVEVKGILELIKAVKCIKQDNIKLLILGSSSFLNGKVDSYTMKLKKEILGFEDRIMFTGYVNNWEVYKYYSLASIMCLPSLWEDAAPLTVIEAMRSKKAVLSTRSGGAPEYLEDTFSVIVDKDKDVVKNLKEGILQLYNDRKKLPDMGLLAYEQSKQFTAEKYFMDLTKLLEDFKKDEKK